MNLEQRIKVFVELGTFMGSDSEEFSSVFATANHKNGWFSEQYSANAYSIWSELLSEKKLNQWTKLYPDIQDDKTGRRIGIIMAGNIPLVGLHDLIAVLLCGHIAVVKLSSDDTVLMKHIIDRIQELSPEMVGRIEVVDQLKNVDAVIATGSNNSARYFEAYFGKYPNIIRKNRTSVAVVSGKETSDDLRRLGADIFTYYGLGCRNVTKLYVPIGYDFSLFFESILEYSYVLNNIKYVHNYDYHKTLYLLNGEQMLDNGFLILKKETKLKSPIGVLHYEYQEDGLGLVEALNADESVQCLVDNKSIKFGATQSPALWDYADEIDTLTFLLNL